jgi:uncharacterized phage protein gp47/JayE
MAYTAPSIGAAGLTLPVYQDIIDYYVDAYLDTYGQNAYMDPSDPDCADYQMLSIEALIAFDVMQLAQIVYNSRAPQTAVGSALDPLGKICGGVSRLAPSYSTVSLTITGVSGTVINNGQVLDQAGQLWNLPAQVTIPTLGTITVTATAVNPGPITDAPGSITIPLNPPAGWLSVTNPGAPTPGTLAESDSQYRGRMAISQSLPSITMFQATIAGVEAVSGVGSGNVFGIENPTGSTDSYGNPPHSISVVARGGADSDVAMAIYKNRGIGPETNGTTTINITDPVTDDVTPISFYRPTAVPIYVTLSVHQLNGYTTATTAAIQAAVANYLNSLSLGTLLVSLSAIEAAAMAVTNLGQPIFSIRGLDAGTSPSPTGTSDITLTFTQAASCLATNVVVNLV